MAQFDVDQSLSFLNRIQLMIQVQGFLRKTMKDANGIPLSSDEEYKMLNDIFDMEDANKDGLISHVEFSGTKHDEF